MIAQLATDRQLSYVKDLLLSRVCPEDAASRLRSKLATGNLTKADASKAIDWLKRQAKQPTVADAVAALVEAPAPIVAAFDSQSLEVGLYEIGDQIFKVKKNKRGTRVYAEVLTMSVGEAQRLTAAGTVIKAKYEFRGHDVIDAIRPEHRITGDRALELTVIFTSCIVCGAHLKAAKSVARGMGRVCFGRV